MLSWVVIPPTSPRETSLSAPGSPRSAINPAESHSCVISQDNSHRMTFLRKNTPGGGPGPHSPAVPSVTPSPLESALTNVYENKQLQTQQNPHLRENWWGGPGPRPPIFQPATAPAFRAPTRNLRTFQPATFLRPC